MELKEHFKIEEIKNVLSFEKNDYTAISRLVNQLNMIFLEKELETKAYSMMMEYYQKTIADTLADKLANIDNMYAMKQLMSEICNSMEQMTTRLIEYQKNKIKDGE